METIYDWVTLGLFAGLIVLFLQRSTGHSQPTDRTWHYLPPAAGCGLANYLGNEGYDVLAIAVIVAVAAYMVVVLKVFDFKRDPGA